MRKRRRLAPPLAVLTLAVCAGACTEVVPLPSPSVAGGDAASTPGVNTSATIDAGAGVVRPPSTDGGPSQGTGDDGPECWPTPPVTRQLVPPQVIIAFDRSSTMDPRVEPIRAKLFPALSALEPAVRFGLLRFPDGKDNVGCCSATDVLVNPALNTASAINSQLTCNAMGGSCLTPGPRCTPTDDAFRKVANFWSSVRGETDRFVLLITDGVPINCNGEVSETCLRAHRFAADLWRSKIKTVVFAISGIATQGNCLSRIAQDGGNAFPSGTSSGMPFVWLPDITDASALGTAINAALGPIRARTCVVTLAGPRRQVNDVVVRVNGVAIQPDTGHATGWDFEPSSRTSSGAYTEIRIGADHCKDILSGKLQAKNVQTEVTCQDCGNGTDCQ